MGIKTKAFGPAFWVMLEGIAEFFDQCMLEAHHEKQQQHRIDVTRWVQWMASLIYCVGFILPCVYCRISYRSFIHPEQGINVEHWLTQPHGAKQLIYLLHDKVNEKLYIQELMQIEEKYQGKDQQVDLQIAAQKAIIKWQKHRISYEEAITTAKRFRPIIYKDFWLGFFMSICFSLGDFRPLECQHLWRFMLLWSQMLHDMAPWYHRNQPSQTNKVTEISYHYQYSLQTIENLCAESGLLPFIRVEHKEQDQPLHQQLSKRMRIVYTWQETFFQLQHWPVPLTFDATVSLVSQNIVSSCDKTPPTVNVNT